MSTDTSDPLSPNEYQVGWICALPLEAAAATALLDEEHPSLDQDPGDTNAYTLGRIGQHNVVIGCLPLGSMGESSATAVAKDMLRSFPNIKIGLMVGVGGGAPGPPSEKPEDDIRLGDIVVSKPGPGHGGVIQYDYGKTLSEGEFVDIGYLNRPPNVLLTALTKLLSRIELEGSSVSRQVAEIGRKYPRRSQDWKYQGVENDQLYVESFRHADIHRSCHDIRCAEAGDRMVSRKPRDSTDPVIHCGLIASGNQVMRDSVTREKLRKKHGVLCFEMEAAGLNNNFPCLVPYAAAVSAAFTKQLLQVIPVAQLERAPKVSSIIGKLEKEVQKLNDNIRPLLQTQQSQERHKVLDWLAPGYYQSQHADIQRHLDHDSGKTFTEHEFFKAWSRGSNDGLGARFMLTSRFNTLIEGRFRNVDKCFSLEILAADKDMEAYIARNFDFTIFYQIPDESSEIDRFKQVVIRASKGMFLLVRLFLNLLKDKCTRGEIQDELENIENRRTRDPLHEAYKKTLHMIAKGGRSEWAYRVMSWVFHARRPLEAKELQEALAAQTQRDVNRLDMNYAPPDIQTVISYCSGLIVLSPISGKIEFVHFTAYQYFKDYQHENPWVTKSRHASFLDYAIQFWAEHTRHVQTDGEVREAAKRFLQNTLLTSSVDRMLPANDHTYVSLSLLIDDFETFRATGLHMVARFGLVTQLEDLLEGIPAPEINTRDPYGQTPLILAVRYGHQDVVDIFLNRSNADPNLADDDGLSPLSIASQLGYSALDGLSPIMYAARGGHNVVIKLLLADEKTNPGPEELTSAVRTSGGMFLTAVQSGSKELIRLLLQHGHANAPRPLGMPAYVAVANYMGLPASSDNPQNEKIFWLAIEKGLVDVVVLLLHNRMVDPDLADSGGKTVLMVAAENRHKEVVEALLHVGSAFADAMAENGDTALFLAVARRDIEITRILLYDGMADPNLGCLKNNYSDIVEILLETSKIDPNPGFQAAIATWQIPLVRIFLSLPGVDPNIEDRTTGETPLVTATRRQDLEMVRVLLQSKTVDVNARNSRGETALMTAVRRRYLDMVQVLLQSKAVDVNTQNSRGETALMYATRENDFELVRLLVEDHGADTDMKEQPTKAADRLSVGDVEIKKDELRDGQNQPAHTTDMEFPSGLRLALLLVAVYASLFLVSLDRLIISPAIPRITDQFHSINDIGCVKGVFLTAILFFEVGSAICGAAPNSVALIIGRAIAGLGSGGIMAGTIVIMVYAVPLHKRPLYMGLFGAIFGVSSVAGPLLGGAFTSEVTWRWCFYINLPFGGVAMFLVTLLLHVPERDSTKLPLRMKILQLDFAGISFLLPGIVCLTLALQWGGVACPWNEGRIIALLVLTGVCLIAFVLVQIFLPDTATMPPRIFWQRSIVAAFWASFCIGSQMIFVYFLPIWFQAIKSVSAIDSGIYLLPLILPMFFASILSGGLMSRLGYYTPFMIAGNCIMAVGAGLLTTLQVDTHRGNYIGYQVLYGFGMGNILQVPNLAAQTVLEPKDIPVGASMMSFAQQLGGAIFVSIGQTVLTNQLATRLAKLQGFNPSMLTKIGATSLIDQLPASIRDTAIAAYNEALRTAFQVGLIIVCLTMLGSMSLEWRSVKKSQKPTEANDTSKDAELEDGVRKRGEQDGASEPER
ncbi:hypothetical protein ATEIFO6365_0003020400 [Aspergillus terreus]|uniref:Uncharacterized protein n=1 Tax=Aspergillus terreus TaxID=33178 RepID=A0A5M3YVV0_ASPTE|nr:hypothetical protein ATETN484_0003014300 [Aspergillus terreus]GFF14151.1 hypothetical protein ATEIFO6365_0003020400 [Aspergillus terreus]